MSYITVDVDIDLDIIDDDTLVEELTGRGYKINDEAGKLNDSSSLIHDIYEAYTLNQTARVDTLLRELFYENIGRVAR